MAIVTRAMSWCFNRVVLGKEYFELQTFKGHRSGLNRRINTIYRLACERNLIPEHFRILDSQDEKKQADRSDLKRLQLLSLERAHTADFPAQANEVDEINTRTFELDREIDRTQGIVSTNRQGFRSLAVQVAVLSTAVFVPMAVYETFVFSKAIYHIYHWSS